MAEKADVWQGTLAIMVLKTLDTLGPLHGYMPSPGVSSKPVETSWWYATDPLSGSTETGTGSVISAEWGISDNNRRAKYYALTGAGKKQLAREARKWGQTTATIARFFSPSGEAS